VHISKATDVAESAVVVAENGLPYLISVNIGGEASENLAAG
jgi:hypothetical protein